MKIVLAIALLLMFSACQVKVENSGDSTNANAEVKKDKNDGDSTNTNVEIKKDVPSVVPSTQNSKEIISLIKNNSSDISFEEIKTGIEQADGNGPFYSVDENGSYVFMMYTAQKYYGKNNWIFCHASDDTCHRVIDNSNQQRFGGLAIHAGGKLFMLIGDKRVNPGTYAVTLAYYDPNTKEFNQRALDLDGINGESFSFTLGVDGYLYVGGSNHKKKTHYASYAKINPNDLSDYTYVTDYYKDLYLNRNRDIGVDNTHIYEAIGDNPWELIAVNKSNNTSKKLLVGKFFNVEQLPDGVGLRYKDVNGVDKKAWLFNGKVYPVESLDSNPPWNVNHTYANNHPSDNPTGYWAYHDYWSVTPGFAKPKTTHLQLGKIYPIRKGVGEVKYGALINNVEHNFTQEVDTYVQLVKSLRVVDDNRMMIVGRSYSGSSMMNLDDESTKYLGSYHVSPNVYKTFLDYSDNKKKFLFSGYPSATTRVYTLNPTNEQFSKDNFDASLGYLRKISDQNDLRDGVDIDIHRTTGMVQVDEMVYFTGMQYRSGVGGAFIKWNTSTGEKLAYRKGMFENYQPRDMIKVGGKIAIATQAVDNSTYGGKARPATPKIMMFNPKTDKFEEEYTPLKGLPAMDVGRIATIDDRYIIGLSSNGGTSDNKTPLYSSRMYLYMIDTYTKKVVMVKTIETGNYMRVEPHGTAFIDGFTFMAHGDYIYTWMSARTLVTIDKTGTVEAHGNMPFQSKMEFANGNIYFTGHENLLKTVNPK